MNALPGSLVLAVRWPLGSCGPTMRSSICACSVCTRTCDVVTTACRGALADLIWCGLVWCGSYTQRSNLGPTPYEIGPLNIGDETGGWGLSSESGTAVGRPHHPIDSQRIEITCHGIRHHVTSAHVLCLNWPITSPEPLGRMYV
eukprot:6700176-Pyramimonas_sp.AAC.2